MVAPGQPAQIRLRIALLLQEATKAYAISAACDRLGMPPEGEDAWEYNSKRVYVEKRLERVALPELLVIAQAVIDEYGDPELTQLLTGDGFRGVDGELKNLIFAAIGHKPRIVFRDAINNVIEIVEGADRCLVYDRPLAATGLTWGALLDWCMAKQGLDDEREGAESLYRRLYQVLESPPEQVLFRQYCRRYGAEGGRDVPALVPQVYLHYDPYTSRELAARGAVELPRQRMDFLLLPSDRARIVIEVDGKHHYADGEVASPRRYSEMVREDRAIRLDGYEVFRFGAVELLGEDGEAAVDEFFDRLLKRHSV